MAFDEENILNPREARRAKLVATDVEDVLQELGIGKRKEQGDHESLPLNKYWLHDTPGAINDSQVNGPGALSLCSYGYSKCSC